MFSRFQQLVLSFFLLSCPTAVFAQSHCEDPTDPTFLAYMEGLSAAVEVGDFEHVLAILDNLQRDYDYVMLQYARARSLHRLDRFSEAEQAYTEFLRVYADCPDPDNLDDTATQYRSLAIEEHRALLAEQAAEATAAAEQALAETRVDPTGDDTGGTAPEANAVEVNREDLKDSGGFRSGWILVSLGGALVTSGVIFDLVNMGLYDEQEEAQGKDRERFESLNEEWERYATIDVGLYGSGIVLIVAGVIWVLLDSGDEEPPIETGFMRVRGGTVFTLGGTF